MSWVKVALAGLAGYAAYRWYEAKKHPAVTLATAPGALATYTVHDPNGQEVLVSANDPSLGSPGTTSVVDDGTLAQATTKPVTLSSDSNLALVSLAPPAIGSASSWPLLGWIPLSQLSPA
ncbi:MAG: hypothetical protein ACYCPT_02025 [Acidimicrobiales bacterium]